MNNNLSVIDGGVPVSWLDALRLACEKSSQTAVAKRLGVSGPTVSQVLSGKYGADTRKIEARVRGELMGECVKCPVVGEINRLQCVEYQGKKFSPTNPVRVKLFRACPSCPNWLE